MSSKVISVIGCGQSAKEWYKTPCDLSIGVNDCVKHGHDVDWLVVVNVVQKFQPRLKNDFIDRLKTIIDSKPKRFFCHNGAWKQWFPEAELLQLMPFRGRVQKFRIASSKTSSFVALHLAFQESPTDIILWGIDFQNHPYVHGQLLQSELSEYRRLFEALEQQGIKVWIGNDQTVLKDYLPTWNSVTAL